MLDKPVGQWLANCRKKHGLGKNQAVARRRTGSVTVSRAHVEQLQDGTEVRLGVFLSNTKARRAKLDAEQL
ncbi:hypothetical protein [Streptomyces collinus]|uniref:hypothetical protein n=1 Tax=Streptomyces collinus TaxID=42684 RepID=UPI0036A46118